MNILSPSVTATHSPGFLVCTPLVAVLCKADCNFPVQSHASRLTLRCGFCCADFSPFPDGILSPSSNVISWNKRQRRHDTRLRTTRRESPYEVLGISPSASADQIKRAYRRLALKYHPDVNKEANAQEKFMRVKHAYNTLLNSEARRRYDSSEERYDSSYSTAGRNQTKQEEEEFYGFGDFLKDLQEEFQNWESSAASQGKPKSLWEELAEIGEDFVEFLEKELNISDQEGASAKTDSQTQRQPGKGNASNNDDNIEESIDEIEAMLAQLKKELGL